MKKYLYLFLFAFGLLVFPYDAFAIGVDSGMAYPYVSLGNQNVFPEYDNGYTHSHSHSINLKNSQDWYSLQGSQDEGGYYTVIKKIKLELTASESLTSGNTYKLVINTDYDAYITFTDFYGWRWIVNRNLTSCKMGNTDMASCSLLWSPVNSTTHNGSNMTILFTPNSNGSSFSFEIGTISGSQYFVAWNRYGGSQNFNMNFNVLSLDSYSQGNEDIILNDNRNTDRIIDNQNANQEQTNDRLDNINDSLNDDTAPSSNDIDGAFADINPTADSTFSSVITAPLSFIRGLSNVDSCQPLSLTMFHHSFNLPCGTTLFWQNANYWSNDEFIGEFPTFWNIFVGGIIIYRLALGVYRAIQDALDPQKHDTLGVDI